MTLLIVLGGVALLTVAVLSFAIFIGTRSGRSGGYPTPAPTPTHAPAPTPTVPVAGQVATESRTNDWLRGVLDYGLLGFYLALAFLVTVLAVMLTKGWKTEEVLDVDLLAWFVGIVVAIFALHLVRRAFRTSPPPTPTSTSRTASPKVHPWDYAWSIFIKCLLLFVFFCVATYYIRATWGTDLLDWDLVKNLEYLNEFEETARMWRVSAVVGAIAVLALVAVVCSRFLLICLILAVLALGLYNREEIGQRVATSVCKTVLGDPLESTFGKVHKDEDNPCRRSDPSP
jgi:hypothetical protein